MTVCPEFMRLPTYLGGRRHIGLQWRTSQSRKSIRPWKDLPPASGLARPLLLRQCERLSPFAARQETTLKDIMLMLIDKQIRKSRPLFEFAALRARQS
jgi:hypothetical protein